MQSENEPLCYSNGFANFHNNNNLLNSTPNRCGPILANFELSEMQFPLGLLLVCTVLWSHVDITRGSRTLEICKQIVRAVAYWNGYVDGWLVIYTFLEASPKLAGASACQTITCEIALLLGAFQFRNAGNTLKEILKILKYAYLHVCHQ